MYFTKRLKKDIDRYILYELGTRNLSPKTIRAYTYDINCFDRWVIESKIRVISGITLKEYFVYLKAHKKLKSSTIDRKHKALLPFFRFISIDISSIANYKNSKNKNLPKTLSKAEVVDFFNILDNAFECSLACYSIFAVRDNALLSLIFTLGLRVGEASNILLSDINLEERTILIRGKGSKQRMLYLANDTVIKKINNWLDVRCKLSLNCNNLFVSKYGGLLTIDSIEYIFCKYRDLSNINPKATPHWLRHTFASQLLENGADIRSVQELLGHANISTTTIYTHITMERKKDVLTRFGPRYVIPNDKDTPE